jgi:ArsR family transcriptional regulator
MTTTETTAPGALAALADPLRWRIFQLLRREELCVCHLVEELEVSQSLVSHHLKVLRDAGLVAGEKWRYWTYYRLVPGAVADLIAGLGEITNSTSSVDRRPCC